jgi:hypothetical protein
MKRALVVAALLLAACDDRPPVAPMSPEALDAVVVEQVQPLGEVEQVGAMNAGMTGDDDESVSWSVNLELNKCYALSAAGDAATVEHLKLYLFNPAGQRVLTKEEEAPRILASFCVNGATTVHTWGFGASVGSATPGIYKIELKTTEGHGAVHLGLFVMPTAPQP